MPLHSLLRIRCISCFIILCLLHAVSAEAKPDMAGAADLQAKATRGYVKQELELAADYFAGRGVPKDLTQSAYWYRKAADQGNPAAQVYLGYMYTVGMGVPQDKTEAIRWYRRAASAGNAEAEVNMAALYIRGDGIKQDIQEALRLLKSAAEKRDGRADAYLGLASYMGLGGAVDHTAPNNTIRKQSFSWRRLTPMNLAVCLISRMKQGCCGFPPLMGTYPLCMVQGFYW
jgi:TPR repeat protein